MVIKLMIVTIFKIEKIDRSADNLLFFPVTSTLRN